MFSIYTVVSFQSNEHGSVVPKGTALRGIPIRRCKTTDTSFAKELLAEQRGFYKASQCAVYPSDDPTPPNPYSPEIAGIVVPTRQFSPLEHIIFAKPIFRPILLALLLDEPEFAEAVEVVRQPLVCRASPSASAMESASQIRRRRDGNSNG